MTGVIWPLATLLAIIVGFLGIAHALTVSWPAPLAAGPDRNEEVWVVPASLVGEDVIWVVAYVDGIPRIHEMRREVPVAIPELPMHLVGQVHDAQMAPSAIGEHVGAAA